MELTYHGANAVRITTKKAVVVIDDYLEQVGLKNITKDGDIALFTGEQRETKNTKLTISQPGEYEVSDISIQGIAAQPHIGDDPKQSVTIYKIISDDINVAVLGHISANLTDDQLEKLGQIDVLIVPVGGHGYTLDGMDALKVIKKIEPRLVIPTHFAESSIKYEVPQDSFDEALKALAMEPRETVPKLKIKASDLPENVALVVLERL